MLIFFSFYKPRVKIKRAGKFGWKREYNKNSEESKTRALFWKKFALIIQVIHL